MALLKWVSLPYSLALGFYLLTTIEQYCETAPENEKDSCYDTSEYYVVAYIGFQMLWTVSILPLSNPAFFTAMSNTVTMSLQMIMAVVTFLFCMVSSSSV